MKAKTKFTIFRDDKWLLSRLDFLWDKYFTDVAQTNEQSSSANKVFIRFGRFAKYRLGSIRLKKQTKESFITITSMFKDLNIPQEVVDHTIGHELVHYAHGFSSAQPRLHRYPHAGGVVKKEMVARGMGYLYSAYKSWIKDYRGSLRRSYG